MPAGTVRRVVPVRPRCLLLIFFASYVPGALTNFTWNPTALQAVVFGLTLYNGSVAGRGSYEPGINAITEGAVGGWIRGRSCGRGQLMSLILVPPGDHGDDAPRGSSASSSSC